MYSKGRWVHVEEEGSMSDAFMPSRREQPGGLADLAPLASR